MDRNGAAADDRVAPSRPAAVRSSAPPPPPAPPLGDEVPRHDTVFVDAHEDRWAWRRKIKADPTLRKVYRGAVGFVGVLLMVVAAGIGWLPGPAGIPLFLLGLAILASEFDWAHRLLRRAKKEARRLEERARRQPRWVKWLGGVGTAAGIALVAWGYLAVLGVPGWFPDAVANALLQVPAVERAG